MQQGTQENESRDIRSFSQFQTKYLRTIPSLTVNGVEDEDVNVRISASIYPKRASGIRDCLRENPFSTIPWMGRDSLFPMTHWWVSRVPVTSLAQRTARHSTQSRKAGLEDKRDGWGIKGGKRDPGKG